MNVTYPAGSGHPSGGTPVAAPVCRSFCEMWVSACAAPNSVPGIPEDVVYNCTYPWDVLWDNWTVPLFPITNQTLLPVKVVNGSVLHPSPPPAKLFYLGLTLWQDYQTYELPVPCFSGDNLTLWAPPQFCPSPLFPDPLTGLCSFGCPLPLIGPGDYSSLETIMSVFGWMAFISTAFAIATYIIDSTKWKYPAILPLFFISCINGTPLSLRAVSFFFFFF